MMYARIDLSKTNYEIAPFYKRIGGPNPKVLEGDIQCLLCA